MEKFIERLNEIYYTSGLTKTAFAKEIKTSQANVSRWLSGKNLPTIDYVYTICNVFNVSFDYLIGVENDFGVIERPEQSLKTQTMKADEMDMLKMYRILSVLEKAKVIGYIQAQYANHV